MTQYCVDISGIGDDILDFLGYHLADETDQFKVYRDKYAEDHIVFKARPLLYVEDANDALVLRSKRVINLPPEAHVPD
jgi:hypothetical protein